MQHLDVLRGDHPVRERLLAHPLEQLLPVVGAEEDDGEVEHLAGLDQRQRLEQLVERAEPAREDDEALRRLHEHRLAGVEVLERHLEVAVGIEPLLVRERDVEADREAAALLAAAVRRLHHARPAAGDDRESRLRELPRRLARLPVGLAVLPDPGRAEDRDGRPVDLEHLLEAAEELARDDRDVVLQVLVRPLEDAPVVGRAISGGH